MPENTACGSETALHRWGTNLMGSLKPKPGPSCILKRPSLLETPCTLLTTGAAGSACSCSYNSSPACRLLAVTIALQELCRAACALPQVRVVLFSAYFLLEGGKGRKARLSLRQLVKWDAPALLGAAEEAICVGKHLPPLQQAAVPETGVSAETMKDKKKMPCSRAIFTRVVQFLIQQAYSSSSTSLITLAAILGVA